MKRIILFSGKMQSGKNQSATFAHGYFSSLGMIVEETLFAYALKDDCQRIFNDLTLILEKSRNEIHTLVNVFIDNHMQENMSYITELNKTLNQLTVMPENWWGDKTAITRNLLQVIGQYAREVGGAEWWVNKTWDIIRKSTADVVLITDCRYENEVDMIRKLVYGTTTDYDVSIVRVNRDIDRSGSEHQHTSETALDAYRSFNYVIDNNYLIEDLKNNVTMICKDVLKGVRDGSV